MERDRRPLDALQGAGWEPLDDADRRQLARRGIAERELRRQLEILRGLPWRTPLARCCTPGDGILSIPPDRRPRLLERWREAALAGRLSKLVPASGAASRMFRELRERAGDPPPGDRDRLILQAADGDDGARSVLRLLDHFANLPFAGRLAAQLAAAGHDPEAQVRDGRYVPILRCLLDAGGLDYGRTAKALIDFHDYPEGARTAFAEHLVESAEYLRDADGRCRLHFTVAPDQRAGFDEALSAARRRPAAGRELHYEVEFSTQDPATDTVAVDRDGRLARDADGGILFRPAGHGALLPNLEAMAGDVVLLQNVDNVVPEHRQAPVVLWKRLLTGLALELEEELEALRRELEATADEPDVTAAALGALSRTVAVQPPSELARMPHHERRLWTLARLRRPLRVCGVVPNAGEPGGGPFWVPEPGGGASGQIVEPAEIDSGDPGQRQIWQASTHFNPVNLVLLVRDAQGRPHPLAPLVDERRVLVARRWHEGRELLALERPGLWNGAMAGWNSCFVELPGETFNPVKTVFDLLRPEHRPPR